MSLASMNEFVNMNLLGCLSVVSNKNTAYSIVKIVDITFSINLLGQPAV